MNFLELPNLSFNKNNATFAAMLDLYIGGTTEPVHLFCSNKGKVEIRPKAAS